jgi:hypothetical protein
MQLLPSTQDLESAISWLWACNGVDSVSQLALARNAVVHHKPMLYELPAQSPPEMLSAIAFADEIFAQRSPTRLPVVGILPLYDIQHGPGLVEIIFLRVHSNNAGIARAAALRCPVTRPLLAEVFQDLTHAARIAADGVHVQRLQGSEFVARLRFP